VTDRPQGTHHREAIKIILPEVQMRRTRAQKALVAGNKPPAMSDTIGWMEISGERKVDYVAAQLSLTVAAIHATTEALTSALADLAIRPHIILKLREEMIRVIRQEGWSAQGLYKMRLLDSFLKESQRMHPVSLWLCCDSGTVGESC
jgi:cytochrome P450